jgi:hypothetical protein
MRRCRERDPEAGREEKGLGDGQATELQRGKTGMVIGVAKYPSTSVPSEEVNGSAGTGMECSGKGSISSIVRPGQGKGERAKEQGVLGSIGGFFRGYASREYELGGTSNTSSNGTSSTTRQR